MLPQFICKRSKIAGKTILDRAERAIITKDMDSLAGVARELWELAFQQSFLAEPIMIVAQHLAQDPRSKVGNPEFDLIFGMVVIQTFANAIQLAPENTKLRMKATEELAKISGPMTLYFPEKRAPLFSWRRQALPRKTVSTFVRKYKLG